MTGLTISARSHAAGTRACVGDNATVLVFRHLLVLTDADLSLLKGFAEAHRLHVWLQPGGPDSAKALHPQDSSLYYDLPEWVFTVAYCLFAIAVAVTLWLVPPKGRAGKRL